jgi:hypothetical protein
MIKISSLIVFLFMTSAVAYAEEAKPGAPPPPPPEVQKTVDALTGNWATNMTLTMPGQAPAKFKGTWHCKKIAGGTAVECSLSTKVPGLGLMEETGLWGYDPETKSVRSMIWNNMGEIHDRRGAWKDDKTIEMTLSATAGGKPLEETLVMTLNGPKKLTFKSVSKTAEGTTIFEGEGTRK